MIAFSKMRYCVTVVVFLCIVFACVVFALCVVVAARVLECVLFRNSCRMATFMGLNFTAVFRCNLRIFVD